MINRINKSVESGASNETLEDVIEEHALSLYEDNPYLLIEPKGSGVVGEYGNTFAYGNDDVGYQTFINGSFLCTAPRSTNFLYLSFAIQLLKVSTISTHSLSVKSRY